MKKSVLVFIFIIVGICGCAKENYIYIPKEVNTILEDNGICNAKINRLGNYSKCKMNKINSQDIVVSNEEIERYVEMQLESFSEIVLVENRKTVEKGDVVYVSYTVYQKGKLLKQVEHDNLIVGKGNYDIDFENALVGRKIGEPFSMNYNCESEEVLLNITIESINYFKTYKLTNDFVREKFGINTVEEYYQDCKQNLEKEKEKQQKMKAEKDLFLSIAKECKFELNTDEIANYSMKYVQEYEKLANVYNLDLQSYVEKIQEKNLDEFFQECYELSELEIKTYLIVGAIFDDMDMEITSKEYVDECERMGYKNEEIKEAEYKDATIRYNVMKEKVLEKFL